MAILKLSPLLLKKIWGGIFLTNEYNEKFPYPIGESLEFSTLDGMKSSTLEEGDLFNKIIEKHAHSITFLIKFLDTNDHLSVQVHPDDTGAKKLEEEDGNNIFGKNECWLVLHSQPNAGIYLGFKRGVSKDIFHQAVLNSLNQKLNIADFLNFFPVSAGDFFYVPAKTIHAVGKGIVLLETQQTSGLTYRVWDWNRIQNNTPRQLHINKAMQVLEFQESKNQLDFFKFKKNLFDFSKHNLFKNKQSSILIKNKDFTVKIHYINKRQDLTLTNELSVIVCCLGSGLIYKNSKNNQSTSKKYQTFDSFLINEESHVNIKPNQNSIFIEVH